MKDKINSVLKEVLNSIEPPKEDIVFIKQNLKDFLEKFEKSIKKSKIKAEVFIGGSFAKGTVIKKDIYDIDVFVRFSSEYEDAEISKLLGKIIKSIKRKAIKIHGSRDYFRIKVRKDFFIELIPVTKVSNPKDARNITDLSYSHVNYIKKKIKNKKILEDIKIAKAFCYAIGCYGAESYIKGFSGYSLELLVYYYKGFINFIKAMNKINTSKGKEVIDIERHYRNKKIVLMDVNSSKLESPIILIDPTYKQRNALAALSEETFKRFQTSCKKFLKKPSLEMFETKKIDLEKIKKNAKKNKLEFIELTAKTNKQTGDVAGSKLLKFFKYIGNEIARYFEIKHNGFGYDGKKSATYYFVVKKRKELLFQGPFAKDKKSVSAFKKKHKKTFIKNKKVHARDKITFDIKKFISGWKKKNKRVIKEMSIIGLE